MIRSILQSAIRPFARSMSLPVEKLAVISSTKLIDARNIHLTSNVEKYLKIGQDRIRTEQVRTRDAAGENSIDLSYLNESLPLYPEENTYNKLFNNIPYNKLHIVNIKVSLNNTIISVTNYRGSGMLISSAGIEGFKNAKKGTNIAAQQTATKIGQRAIEEGIKTVRVKIQGLGPGRMGALKGLQVSGLQIVSLTDCTRVSWNPQRPRKKRRI